MKRKPKASAPRRSRAWVGFLVAMALGAGGWIGTSLHNERILAWEGPLYFEVYLGFTVTSGVLALIWPAHIWRWPLALVAGQLIAFSLHNPTEIPLLSPMVYLTMISVPLLLPALAAVRFRQARNPEPAPAPKKSSE